MTEVASFNPSDFVEINQDSNLPPSNLPHSNPPSTLSKHVRIPKKPSTHSTAPATTRRQAQSRHPLSPSSPVSPKSPQSPPSEQGAGRPSSPVESPQNSHAMHPDRRFLTRPDGRNADKNPRNQSVNSKSAEPKPRPERSEFSSSTSTPEPSEIPFAKTLRTMYQDGSQGGSQLSGKPPRDSARRDSRREFERSNRDSSRDSHRGFPRESNSEEGIFASRGDTPRMSPFYKPRFPRENTRHPRDYQPRNRGFRDSYDPRPARPRGIRRASHNPSLCKCGASVDYCVLPCYCRLCDVCTATRVRDKTCCHNRFEATLSVDLADAIQVIYNQMSTPMGGQSGVEQTSAQRRDVNDAHFHPRSTSATPNVEASDLPQLESDMPAKQTSQDLSQSRKAKSRGRLAETETMMPPLPKAKRKRGAFPEDVVGYDPEKPFIDDSSKALNRPDESPLRNLPDLSRLLALQTAAAEQNAPR